MSDDAAQHFQSKEPLTKALPDGVQKVTLSLTLHPNGQIECSLPANKVLAYGLLGIAQEQLAKHALMAEFRQMSKSNGGIGGLLKRMKGG